MGAQEPEILAEIVDTGITVDDGSVPVHEEHAAATPMTAEALGVELPDEPDRAISVLLAEIAAAREERDDNLDQLRRTAAAFDNFRKRSIREQQQLRDMASERVVTGILPALDSLEAALALPADSENERRILDGVRGTRQQLLDALTREGLEAIPGLGERFDPTVHEAVSMPAAGDGELVVAHEIRRGYRLGTRVLRPAMVALDYEGAAGTT